MRRFFSLIPRLQAFDRQWTPAAAVARWMEEQLGDWEMGQDVDELGEEALLAIHENNAQAHEQSDADPKPKTPKSGKQALSELQAKTKNVQSLTSKLLQDRDLQVDGRMLADVIGVTYKTYQDLLQQQKDQNGVIAFESSIAVGDWGLEIEKVAALLSTEEVLCRYEISPSGSFAGHQLDNETKECLFNVEQQRASRLFRLVISQMSHRAWSMSYHSGTLPDMALGVLHSDRVLAQNALHIVRDVWKIIEQAEKAVQDGHPQKFHIQDALNKIAFHKHQLVRELIGVAAQGGWSADNLDLYTLCWKMSAGPGNTKSKLEDLFNELRDQERQNKNRRINHWRAWYSVCNAAIVTNYDMPSVTVLPDDYNQPLLAPVAQVTDAIFHPGNTKPDKSLQLKKLSRGAKSMGCRPAGSASNARSVAFCYLLRHCAHNDFADLGQAWTG